MNRLLLICALVLAAGQQVSAQDSIGGVLINEILPDPTLQGGGFDTDQNGVVESTDEFVELYNSSGTDVDITGWEIYEEQGLRFTFPAGSVIPAGGYVVVISAYSGTVPAGYFDASGLNLNDTGDSVFLRDPDVGYVGVAYNGGTGIYPGPAATQIGSGEDFGGIAATQSGQRSPSGSSTIVTGEPTPLFEFGGTPPVTQTTGGLFISEFDPDTPGTDNSNGVLEFVELYAPDDPNTSLTGYVLVFFNGSDGLSYGSGIDLDGFTTDTNGLVVIDRDAIGFNIQNGDDAIAIYRGDGGDFPNDTPPTMANLVDAVVYSQGNQARSTALLNALGQTVQYDEGFDGANTETVSFQRLFRDGEGAELSKTFYVFPSTPGADNPRLVTVDETDAVEGVEGETSNDDDQGWRMLAMPGFDGDDPFAVGDIALLNLIQGVPAGSQFGPQYPNRGANILTAASGESTRDPLNSFQAPASTDTELLPGAGFFWYFYDFRTIVGPTGSSFSRDLADPDFSLAFDVNPPDPFLDGDEYELTAPAVRGYVPPGLPNTPNPDPNVLSRFYFIGNPYAYPYALGGIDPTNNAQVSDIQDNVYIWNPVAGTSVSNSVTIKGSYEIRVANTANPFSGASAGRLNGFFVELATNSDDDVTFAFPSGFQRPRIDAGTVAKTSVEGQLALTMEGVTATGKGVLDMATLFRFNDEATFEWDRMDGTNVASLDPTYALIAPIGVNNGNPWPHSVYSMPKTITEAHSVPMAFVATEGGTFVITWEATALPEEWTVTLRDNATGANVDLGTADRYEFAADATTDEWEAGAERFTVSFVPSNAVSTEPTAEGSMALSAPMPNPASGATRIVLSAGASESIRVTVYDALGREVSVLRDGPMASGDQATLTLDTTTLAAGVYVIRAEGENGSLTQRLTVTR